MNNVTEWSSFWSQFIVVTEWLCLMLMIHEIVYVQGQSTDASPCVPGQPLDRRSEAAFL